MRTERRTSGSARGDEKLAAERRYGAHRLLNRFMRPWSSATIRSCAADLSLWRGAGIAPWAASHEARKFGVRSAQDGRCQSLNA